MAASTYNRHPDGTGISLSSLRRPVLTLRPGFLTFNDARGSGLRHFSADSHLTDWLDAIGQGFDVITDHDLHREGAALLAPYRCVVTGSHPEYHTPQTLDALQAYIGGGGRLCYLGGNGFYWRIAVSASVPDVLEVRRAEGGIRAWDAAPGEAYHQLDGGYGGLWRRLGRPPQPWPASASPPRGCSRGRITGGCRRRRPGGVAGFSMASKATFSAITACPAAALPVSSWTGRTAGLARRPTPSSSPGPKRTRPISWPCRRSC